MGSSEDEIALRFEQGLDRPVEAVMVGDAPCQEVVLTGDDVDLTAIPYPLMHVLDGGPYISATCVVSKDAEYGRNVGGGVNAQDVVLRLQGAAQLGGTVGGAARDEDRVHRRVGQRLLEVADQPRARAPAAQVLRAHGRAGVDGQVVPARLGQGARHVQPIRVIAQQCETHPSSAFVPPIL